MSRLSQYAPFWSLRRPAALFLVLLAVLAVSLSGGGPATAGDGYEPDRQVVADVWTYAAETDSGFDHVLRWMRALKTFGAIEDMTAAEAQGYADSGWERWNPVAEELGKLEDAQSDYEPDRQVIDDVWTYARETDNGFDHVLRWMRALKTLGAVEDMTAAEAQGYADSGWARWDPVAEELRKLEASASGGGTTPEPTPEPTPTTPPETGSLQVAVTASPAHPILNESVKLRAEVSNAPQGGTATYDWEGALGSGEWYSYGSNSTLSWLTGQPESWTFRVTVSYDGGDSATSDPITVTWTETRPNRAPVVNKQAEYYLSDFVKKRNAPRDILVSRIFTGIFTDPDGDELTYAASVPDDRSGLVEEFGISLELTNKKLDFLFIRVNGDDDWKAVSPALPDPLTITATLTATDPDGLSASVSGDWVTDWVSHPALVSATSDGAVIELTFDLELQGSLVPSSFTVNAANEDGSAGTVAVSSVAVSGKVVTLELASALEKGQTVTLDYAHDDDAPLTRAAGGGDSAPSFTGQAVQVSFPDLPGPPQNFDLSATPGSSLDVSATWDALDGATSYKLRWKLDGGDFEPDDETTMTETEADITVSGHGRWVVALQGCNDSGCGPEAEATVDVEPFRFDVSQALDDAGNPRPRTFNADWSPVPNAIAYGLSWRRLAEGDSPSQAQNDGGASKKSEIPGASGNSNGGPGANNQGENRLTIPGDRTTAQFTVTGDGRFEVTFDAVFSQDGEPISLANADLTARLDTPGNVTLFHQFDCAAQSAKITGVYGEALNGGVRITWNTPDTAIDKYQYQIQQGSGFYHGRDDWTDIDLQAQPPTTRKLVGNTDQTHDWNFTLDEDYAQGFLTGPNNAGYILTAADIDLYVSSNEGRAPDIAVGIYSVSGDDPDALLVRLAASSPLGSGLNTFTAPGQGFQLDRNTPYYLIVTVADAGDWDVRIRGTTTQNDDDDRLPGWIVGNNHIRRAPGEAMWTPFTQNVPLRVAVQGYAERNEIYGYLQTNTLAGTTSYTVKGLENGSSTRMP